MTIWADWDDLDLCAPDRLSRADYPSQEPRIRTGVGELLKDIRSFTGEFLGRASKDPEISY